MNSTIYVRSHRLLFFLNLLSSAMNHQRIRTFLFNVRRSLSGDRRKVEQHVCRKSLRYGSNTRDVQRNISPETHHPKKITNVHDRPRRGDLPCNLVSRVFKYIRFIYRLFFFRLFLSFFLLILFDLSVGVEI